MTIGSRLTVRVPRELVSVSCIALIITLSTHAEARLNGIASDCLGCHQPEGAAISLRAEPSTWDPGGDVTFTVSISHEGSRAGGVYIAAPESGEIYALVGEGLAQSEAGLTHSEPKLAQNGVVTFRFGWRAPAEPGGVNFSIRGVAANANAQRTGDVAGAGEFSWAFGCVGQAFHLDVDADGYGRDGLPAMMGCPGSTPAGYAAVAGDCNDNHAAIHPDATEQCNLRDDDCDGEIDEGSVPVLLYPDADRDGYYGFAEADGVAPVSGCVGMSGLAAESGDCAASDDSRNPGAEEVCNLLDDNCDGRIDERVRPRCGVGFCTREAYSCNEQDCIPGEPTPERCNLLDDDCNGEIDDGDLCNANEICSGGGCLALTDPGGGGAGAAIGGVAGGSAGGAGAGTNVDHAGNGSGGASGGALPQRRSPHASGCAMHPARVDEPIAWWTIVVLAMFRRRPRPAR